LRTACLPKRNRITSVAAIVAPQTCDLVRGAFGASNTGASRLLTYEIAFFSCVRLYPNSAQSCISLLSRGHPQTKGERTSRPRIVWAEWGRASRASNDEECRFQCPRSWPPELSKMSSSKYSSTPLDLSSGNSNAAHTPARQRREYLSFRLVTCK